MVKVLLMEDDLALSFQLAKKLEDAGHDTHACASASAAQEELFRSNYDLLITDVIVKVDGRSVPDGGIGLISWVRRSKEHMAMPIIAMTGTFKYPGMQHILDMTRQMGADVGIEKPIDVAELLEKIDELTASKTSVLP